MPTLYPENTQYSSPGLKTPMLSALSKVKGGMSPNAIQDYVAKLQQMQQLQQMSALQRSIPKPSLYEMAEGTVPQPFKFGVESLGTRKSIEETGEAQPSKRMTVLPPGYQTWKPDEAGKWVAPTEAARIVSMPSTLGGGEYIMDPTQPGRLIKSERGPMTDFEKFKKLSPEDQEALRIKKYIITGGSPDVQVDHITPLWVGGSDTQDNWQGLRFDKHKLKTKIQSIPATLFFSGKINRNQAYIMTQQWQYIADNFNTDEIPAPNEYTDPKTGEVVGTIDLKTAERLAKEWKETPPISWDKIREGRKQVGTDVSDWADKNLPSFFSGALKGFVHEGTMGAIPLEEATEKTTTGEIFGRAAGSALGFMVPFLGTTKLLVGGLRLLGKVGAKLGIKALGEKAVEVGSKEALKALPLEATVAATKAAGKKMAKEEGKILIEGGKVKKIFVDQMLKNGALFGTYGIARTEVPVLLGDYNQPGMEEMMSKFAADFAFGGVTPFFGKGIGGTSALMGIILTASFMENKDDPRVLEKSLADALSIGALHQIGFGGERLKLLSKKHRDKLNEARIKSENELIEKYNDVATDAALSHLKPKMEAAGLKPLKKGEKLTPEEADKILEELSKRDMELLVEKGFYDKEDFERVKFTNTVALKQLYEGGLGEAIRNRSKIENIKTVFDALKNKESSSFFTAPDELVRYVKSLPKEKKYFDVKNEDLTLNPDSQFSNIRFQTVGLADSVAPRVTENHKEYWAAAKEGRENPTNFKMRASPLTFTVSRGREMHEFNLKRNDLITEKQIEEGLKVPSKKPYNTEEQWMLIEKDGVDTLLFAGYVPRGKKIEGTKYSINNRRRELNKEHGDERWELDNPEHNKDLVAESKRANGIDILQGFVDPFGQAIESKQPYFIVRVTDKNWTDSLAAKEFASKKDFSRKEKGVSNEEARMSVDEAKAKADYNPSSESGKNIVETIARTEHIDPISELKKSGVPGTGSDNHPVNVITKKLQDILKINDPVKATDRLNKEFDLRLTVEDTTELLKNKNSFTFEDFNNLLSSAIDNGKAAPGAIGIQGELSILSSSPKFLNSKSGISNYFFEIPVMGVGKENIFGKEIVRRLTGQERLKQSLKGYELLKKKLTREEIESNKDKDINNLLNAILKKNEVKEVPQPIIEKKVPEKKEKVVIEKPIKGTITTKAGKILKKETLPSGEYWIEQNVGKEGTKWTKLAKEGHRIEHLIKKDGGYVGKVRIDGKEYTYDEAKEKFLKPKKIYDSAIIADAPNIIVTPEAKKTVIKETVKESIKDDIYRSLDIELNNALENLSGLKDSNSYARGVNGILNRISIRKKTLDDKEYKNIESSVHDNIKSKALDNMTDSFSENDIIQFRNSENPRKLLEIKYKRLLNIETTKKENDLLNKYYKENPIDIEADYVVNEQPISYENTFQLFKKIEKNNTKEEANKIKGNILSYVPKQLKKYYEDTIKTMPVYSDAYGYAKTKLDLMNELFGKNWDRSWKLSYLDPTTSKGKEFLKESLKTTNEQGYPISQPKDVIEKMSEVLQRPGIKGISSIKKGTEAYEYVYGKRAKEAEEISKREKGKGIKAEGFSIKGEEQDFGHAVTDLTFGESRSPGILLSELGKESNAILGYQRALTEILYLIKAFNSNAAQGEKVFLSDEKIRKIEKEIRSGMRDTKSSERIEKINLSEQIRNLKANVESLERKKKEEGYLPEDMSKILEENRALWQKLKSQNK